MCRFSTDCQLIRTDSFARDFYGALISKRRLHNKSIFTSSCFFNQQLCGTDTANFFIRIKQAYYLFVENCANLFHSNQSEYRLNYTAFHIVYTRTVSFTIFNFERVAFQCARKLYCIKMTDYKYLLFAISKVSSDMISILLVVNNFRFSSGIFLEYILESGCKIIGQHLI